VQAKEDKQVMLLALACYCQQHRAALACLSHDSQTAKLMLQELDKAAGLMQRVAKEVSRDCNKAVEDDEDAGADLLGPPEPIGHRPPVTPVEHWYTCIGF